MAVAFALGSAHGCHTTRVTIAHLCMHIFTADFYEILRTMCLLMGAMARKQGTMTEGRLPKLATVAAAIALGSALGGQAPPASQAYASVDAAREGALALAGQAAAATAERYASSVRLQALGGQVLPLLPVQRRTPQILASTAA